MAPCFIFWAWSTYCMCELSPTGTVKRWGKTIFLSCMIMCCTYHRSRIDLDSTDLQCGNMHSHRDWQYQIHMLADRYTDLYTAALSRAAKLGATVQSKVPAACNGWSPSEHEAWLYANVSSTLRHPNLRISSCTHQRSPSIPLTFLRDPSCWRKDSQAILLDYRLISHTFTVYLAGCFFRLSSNSLLYRQQSECNLSVSSLMRSHCSHRSSQFTINTEVIDWNGFCCRICRWVTCVNCHVWSACINNNGGLALSIHTSWSVVSLSGITAWSIVKFRIFLHALSFITTVPAR